MPHHHIREVENYTMPFLVMAFVLLFMALFTLWAIAGYVVSLLTGGVVHLIINRLPRRQ